MNVMIAVDELLKDITAGSPAGDDLRYTHIYEEIMEARRSEEAAALGDWQHDVKRSDWEKVVLLCVAALSEKSKDLQIAAWLTEALTVVAGFEGLEQGLSLLAGLLNRFWDCVYPLDDEGDLEYRAAPFEFLNDKVARQVKQIPVTDKGGTPGHSWHEWRQSREVGLEADVANRYGEVDEEKKNRRDERIAEGALTAEEFDAAVADSEGAFAKAILCSVARCRRSFQSLVALVDKRFAPDVPDLSGLGTAIEACEILVSRLYGTIGRSGKTGEEDGRELEEEQDELDGADEKDDDVAAPLVQQLSEAPPVNSSARLGTAEHRIWAEAVAMHESGRLQEALGTLLHACNSAESPRDRSRMRLLMAQLCLKGDRTDLARPILEELHGLIEELHLDRWESPLWIAEVLDAYYRCLQGGDLPDDDQVLSRTLFRRICSLDVTKAMPYRI